MSELFVKTCVTDILEGGFVIINKGSVDKVSVGDKYKIDERIRVIYDPVSGNSLGAMTRPEMVIVVRHVTKYFSVCIAQTNSVYDHISRIKVGSIANLVVESITNSESKSEPESDFIAEVLGGESVKVTG